MMRASARRILAGVFLGLLALCGRTFGEDATKPHVAVVRFSNGTGVASYDAACKAATDTLALTLTELGRYRVQSEERSGSGEDALRALAEEEQLDFIIYREDVQVRVGGHRVRPVGLRPGEGEDGPVPIEEGGGSPGHLRYDGRAGRLGAGVDDGDAHRLRLDRARRTRARRGAIRSSWTGPRRERTWRAWTRC